MLPYQRKSRVLLKMLLRWHHCKSTTDHTVMLTLIFKHVPYMGFFSPEETMKALLKSSDGIFVLRPKITTIGRHEDSDITLKVNK